jgi:hypothetical protein
MSKMIFKNIKKKHHWHAFQHKKLFEKQPLPHCQALSKWGPCLQGFCWQSI